MDTAPLGATPGMRENGRMSSVPDPTDKSIKVLGIVEDAPLWLLVTLAVFLWMVPFLPGVGTLLPPTCLRWIWMACVSSTILTAFRLVNDLAPIIKRWWARPAPYVTADDTLRFLRGTRHSNGPVATQFPSHFMATNLTSAPHSLGEVHVIQPRMRDVKGSVHGDAQGSDNRCPTAILLSMHATILRKRELKRTEGRLNTAIGIADKHKGDTRVKREIRRLG